MINLSSVHSCTRSKLRWSSSPIVKIGVSRDNEILTEVESLFFLRGGKLASYRDQFVVSKVPESTSNVISGNAWILLFRAEWAIAKAIIASIQHNVTTPRKTRCFVQNVLLVGVEYVDIFGNRADLFYFVGRLTDWTWLDSDVKNGNCFEFTMNICRP